MLRHQTPQHDTPLACMAAPDCYVHNDHVNMHLCQPAEHVCVAAHPHAPLPWLPAQMMIESPSLRHRGLPLGPAPGAANALPPLLAHCWLARQLPTHWHEPCAARPAGNMHVPISSSATTLSRMTATLYHLGEESQHSIQIGICQQWHVTCDHCSMGELTMRCKGRLPKSTPTCDF